MSGWDEGGIFYTEQDQGTGEDRDAYEPATALRIFGDFLRNFREHSADGPALYRDALDHHPAPRVLRVALDDLRAHDPTLAQLLRNDPSAYVPMLEQAASDLVSSLRIQRPVPEGEDDLQERHDVQVLLHSTEDPMTLRKLSSEHVSKMVVLSGIIISSYKVQSKATSITLQCKTCDTRTKVACKPGFGGIMIPRTCEARVRQQQTNVEPCPLDPFQVMPEHSHYMDQQKLKLQENPEDVPVGEMPRNMMLCIDRSLVQKVVPGTRVTLVGIYSIFAAREKTGRGQSKAGVAVRQPYIRVVGLEESTDGNARGNLNFTTSEEAAFKQFAAQPNVLNEIRSKIAPAIFGVDDVKAAVACLLFGGARKHLPDGTRLRGDVNVLLLGDPSTAKSQLLKFVHKTAPIAVYTSGKGSSAAGLTASIIKDGQTGEAYLEGGAMVLADGGVVCIDEFDKMRPEDRVAIHEAMEQQTISIAKAGITTVLNSRTAVMAAANPPSGRYDDMKTAAENIDLQTTILSRFDLIFIVKDERNWEKDMKLAQHVLGVHRDASEAAAAMSHSRTESDPTPTADGGDDGTDENGFNLKRYIQFCRARVSPRLNENAAAALGREYVKIREDQRTRNQQRASTEGANPVPITVRQLEAIVRVSESLARMTMHTEVTEAHVAEALRLFNISTVDAARAGVTDAILTEEQRNDLIHTVAVIKRYLPVGANVSERWLVDSVMKTGVNENAARRALLSMSQRGEVEFRNERRKVMRKM